MAGGGAVVADYGNGRLRTLDAAGRLDTVAWPPGLPMLQGPAGLAPEEGGALLVADYAGNRLFRLRSRDEGEVLAGTGAADEARSERPAQGETIDHPLAVLGRKDGRIVVGDGGGVAGCSNWVPTRNGRSGRMTCPSPLP